MNEVYTTTKSLPSVHVHTSSIYSSEGHIDALLYSTHPIDNKRKTIAQVPPFDYHILHDQSRATESARRSAARYA